MTTRLVMSFAWMVVLAALSSSSAFSLLNETRIEAFDIHQIINEIRGIQDANQIQSGAFDTKTHPEIRTRQIQCPDELRIAAFNIQALGETKLDNDIVMNIISKIVSRYDVILIQEVRSDESRLLEEINKRINKRSGRTYTMCASKPLGSSSYTEKYVFLIRDGTGISLNKNVGTYQFDQNKNLFERAPFSIRIKCSDINFVLTAIHTKPKNAQKEIKNLLTDVYKAILNTWKDTRNILIMGDLNVGYLSHDAIYTLKDIEDRNKHTFDWLLPDYTATTVCSKKPHDRFIMTQDMNTMLDPGSAKVFEFDKENDEDYKTITACCVSDHYPIELVLKLQGRDRSRSRSRDRSSSKRPNNG